MDRFLGNRLIPTRELAKALAQAVASTRKSVLMKDVPLSKIIAWYGRRMKVEEFFSQKRA